MDVTPDSIIEAADEPDSDSAVVVDLERPHDDENLITGLRDRLLRRTPLLAVAAAVAAIFIGILALSIDDNVDVDTIDTPTPTTTTSVPEEDGEAAPLTAGNTFFDTGTFRIDTLGTAFTFSVDETTGLLFNENGVVMLTDLTSSNADDRTITLRRTALLPVRANLMAPISSAEGWSAGDLDGWLAAVSDEVVAGDPIDTMLGGFEARFVELDVPCAESRCTAAHPIRQPRFAMFTPGSRYRLWVVDQRSEDPIVVTVAIDDADES